MDNDPPTIAATAAPAANAAGWNRTDVTVAFTCDDVISGVASCPSPVTVTAEGEGQVVSGTATDRAGNTATASVTLNIDKTAPGITAAAAPAPNAAGWNNSDVSVTFACEDGLSGVAECPALMLVSAEGAGRVVSGTATDRAGNTAGASVTVSLDKTPPVLTITGPIGQVDDPTAEITLMFSDATSGVDTATLVVRVDGVALTGCVVGPSDASCETPALASGSHTIVAEIQDVAGNLQAVAHSFSLIANRAPVLDPIGSQTAPLGQTLSLVVTGADPDGDATTLDVAPVPLPPNATFDRSTGAFTFKPSAEQTGTFDLTFSISDGVLSDSETVTFSVPAPTPGAAGTLQGRVLDANSFAFGSVVPIVNATIALLGTNRSALSDAQGNFVVTDVPGGHQVLDISMATAQPAPDGSAYGGFREAIELIGGVDNVVERPFFLPRIEAASLTLVDPNATTVVHIPTLGVTLTVPPHTAKNADGSDFIGELSISLVPRGLEPAPLPRNLDPGLVVTIQPVGVVFATPVPLAFPNLDQIQPGNDLHLWSLLPSEGRFAVVGRSEVSADGQRIETVSGGVRAADWHLVLAAASRAAKAVGDRKCGPCSQMANAGSDVILSEGSLQEDHTLPGVRSLGVSRSLRLVYDSTSADVRPIIPLDTTLSLRTAVPLTFSAALQVGGVTQGAEVFYDATSLPESADSTSRLAVQFDGSSLPTGRYPFTAGVFSHYAQSAVGAFVESEAIVVNQRQSPIGAGWGIAGLQRLHLQPDGVVLLTDGDGSALAFRPATLGRFAATISMTTRHNRFPAMVLLADGRVLVTGGFNAAGITAAAEIFDPATGTWTATGSMREARQLHTATLLRDGRVLIAGGADQSDGPKSSAELYDPATGQFTYTTGGMNRIRAAHTATLLGDGTVLIAAGASNLGAGISSGEIFNPVTGTFQFTANNMQVDISYHTATLLADGRVLITGGQGRCGFGANRITHIYNPLTRTFARSGNLTIDRSGHRADLLSDGRVLIAGGAQLNACGHEGLTDTIEIFDPVAGASQALPDRLCATKAFPTLAPLGDGRLLIAGGMNVERTGFMTACADIFDPETGILSRTTDMTTPRGRHAATALADGRVLVVGTAFGTDPVDWADLFDVVTAESGAFLSPAGDFTTLTRNPDGTFVRAFKDGTHVRFDVSGLQTSVVDRNGNTTAYSYDPAGRLLTMTDPAGLIWTLAYGAGGLIESITDPAARTTTFEHDAQGNLTKITKPDGTCVHYAYDSQHRLVQKTNERGFPTTYAYDFSGRFASATHPGGEVRRAVGAQTRGVVDPSGGAGTSLNPAPIVRIEDVTATFTDGKDHATTYVLDGLGVATGQTDALGRTTGTVRDANGLPRQITRPNGSVVTMTYEGRGNLLTVTEENDPNGPATTAYTYEPAFNQVTSIRDPKGNTTMIAHDARGNPTTITDALGKSTILTYDSRGLLTSSRDPLGNTATFGYDAQGNVETVTDPRMKTTMLGRDVAGNVTSSRDPLLRVTQTQYDAVNRVTQVTYPLNGITRYGYDEAGNLASLTDAKNQTTTFAYEGRSLLSETTNPLGQTKHYFYDLAEHTLDAKGQRIEFGYDASDQLIAKVLKDASGATTDTVTYGYDLLGNLAAASDSDSGLAFTFDPLGRLAEARTLAGAAQPATTISYAYDKNGNRVRMTDPHGNLTTYGYDPLNRLTTLTSPDGVFTFGYDDAGRRTSLTFPNGARAAYSYDAASQLTSLHYLDAAMALLSKFDYTYDDKGNRESRTTLDGVTTYTYDDLDRLTGAVGPDPANPLQTATESYAYDSVGNRTSSHLATGQVHDVANRLLEDSKFIYTYDANGNLISKLDRATNELTTYEWDVLDQLIAANSPAPLVTFQYDPLGRRMSKVSSTMMRFVYDREDVVEERDGTSALSLRYLHGPGIDEPLGRFDAITNTVSYYAADGLGSITETTNSSGQVSPAYRFDSYGTPVDGHETGGFAFTGREWDPESGLYYYRSRYLDPVMGRFLSEDPAGATAGLNLFAYVGNSPTEWIDPFGLRRRAEYLAAGSPYDLLYHSAIRIYDDERRDVPDLVYSAGGLTSGTYTYQRYRDLRGSEPTDRFPLVLSEDQIRSLQMILEAKFPNGGFYAYDTLTNNCAQVAASSIYEAVGRSGPGILGNLYIGDFGIILTTHQAILHLAIDGLLEDQVR